MVFIMKFRLASRSIQKSVRPGSCEGWKCSTATNSTGDSKLLIRMSWYGWRSSTRTPMRKPWTVAVRLSKSAVISALTLSCGTICAKLRMSVKAINNSSGRLATWPCLLV